jgi:hypothetical protein
MHKTGVCREMVLAPFKKVNRHKLSLNSSLQNAAEFFGVTEGLCCLSLHRSQISQDL